MYSKAIVAIDGFSLIQTLRACRNQVARGLSSFPLHISLFEISRFVAKTCETIQF